MGFRFRKSAKFGPFRINFSKSGVGYSFGGKGFRVTKKAGGGMRTTASIPGTGVSYVKDYSSRKKVGSTRPSGNVPSSSSEPSRKKPIYQRPWFVALVIIVLLGAVGSACGSDNTEQSDTENTQQEETVLPAEDDTTQEAQEDQQSKNDSPEAPDAEETPAENDSGTAENDTPEDTQTQDSPAQAQEPSGGINSQQKDTSAVAPVTPPASTPETQPATQPEPDPAPQATPNDRIVYVTKTGKRYHYDSNCGNGTYYESTLSQAQSRGLTPCKKCAGG